MDPGLERPMPVRGPGWGGEGRGMGCILYSWILPLFCIPTPTYLLSYLSSLPVTTVHGPRLSSYVHNGGEGRQEEAGVRLATTGVI